MAEPPIVALKKAPALSLLLLLGFPIACPVLGRQEDPIQSILGELASESDGGVHDFGNLLKPGGVEELEILVETLYRDELRLWIVTLPGELSAASSTATIHQGLSLREDDVLVVFNGKEVYGQALALRGEPEFFEESLADSRRAFHRYWAAGLAHFSTRIADRIVEKRKARGLLRLGVIAAVVGALLLGILLLGRGIYSGRKRTAGAYQEKVEQAQSVLGELAQHIDEPEAEPYQEQFVALSEEFDKLWSERDLRNLGAMDTMIRRLEMLLEQLRNAST